MNPTHEIEIFRAGDYGERGVYTEADLDRIAADYDPRRHEAPVTLDHAQTGPALGWVEALRRAGGSLFARLRGVGSRLRELLGEGSYKKRSVELYPKFGESGRPYLRAVSFLGAGVPEVKGMEDAALDDIDQNASEQAQPESTNEPETRFVDDETPNIAIDLPEQTEHTEQPDQTTQPALPTPAATQRFAELTDRLRTAGRWQPAWEARGIERFFSALDRAEPVCFAEGDPPLDAPAWFESFLAALPPAVPLGESIAFSEHSALPPASAFASALQRTPGGRIDPASLALDRAVRARMAAHPHESYARALAQCAP